MCHKNNFLYLKLILLLSGDISLNQGPIQNDHLTENWKTFRNRGLHFIHLNINSLLPKIDKLREIVKISNPTVIGIQKFPSTDTVPFDVIETERVEV